MRLLVFLGYKPRFDSVEYHIVDRHSVSQMDRLLNSEDSQYLQLNGRERV